MSKWSLFRESGVWVIRRWEGGKYKRLSVRQYRHIRDNEAELKAFVIRLNAPFNTREAVRFKHAFISPELLEEYREYLLSQLPTERNARCQFYYLVEYFLNYFIGELNLADPRQWAAIHKTKWATFLLSDKAPPSPSVKKKIIQEANRFMEWLAERRPDEVVAIKFRPFSKAKVRKLDSTRRLETKRERFISDEEWAEIKKKLPADIRAAVCLCYLFGLRRSEVLALKPEDVYDDYIWIDKQMLKPGEYSVPKGREPRGVPYWFSSPEEAYELVSALKIMSPDTLAKKLREKVTRKFKLHDLRHTFITKALRLKLPGEVQEVVGHQDLSTTSRYAHKATKYSSKRFSPKTAA